MTIIPFLSDTPKIDPSAFIAPDAWVIGKVSIEAGVSVFFNTVIRGDIQPITIGAKTNLQEHVLVHSSHGMSPVVIGERVTVGHRAIIHGCTIGRCALIGMGATILDDVVIGEHSIIGAHTLITKGTIIPPRSMVIGCPGKIVRGVSDAEATELEGSAEQYATLGAHYRKQLST